MVQGILNILNREFGNIHRAAYILGAFALLSQILALFRDRILAGKFGAGIELDLYYSAFRIPDFIYISVASFVSLTVLIPFLIERLEGEKGRENSKAFLSQLFTFFIVGISGVTIGVFFLIPSLVPLIVPGFSPDEQKEFITLTRILLLSPILLGLSSIFGSVTQVFKKFFVYALAPVLYNLGIIGGIIFLAPFYGIQGIAWGVIIGALLHMLIQLPVIIKENFIPRLRFISWNEIAPVFFLSLPRTIALSANHLALIVLVALGSLMSKGSIAVFNFSFNLQSVPLSIIGVSYSVAAFPTLAQFFSSGKRDLFVSHIVTALRHIIFWSVPAIILLIVLRAQVVRSILGSGSFDWSDTRLTAATLAIFAVSLLAQSLILLFVRGFYAAGKTKIPLFINVFSSAVIIGLAFLFIELFRTHEFFRYFFESLLRIDDLLGTEVIMLPLAYSLGTIMNAILLWFFFLKIFPETTSSIERVFAHAFGSSILMGFVAYHTLIALGEVFNLDTFWGIFLQGFFAGVVGIISWILVLKILKNKEVDEIETSLRGRVPKEVIAPDQEAL